MTNRITNDTGRIPSDDRTWPVVIIGGGPAGLTAAYELIRSNITPLVLEKGSRVGGLSRTEQHGDYRFDIGGHRFFTKDRRIQELWKEMLGDDFLKVPRSSSIYYRERFFRYPIDLFNVINNLGIIESTLTLMSYIKARIAPHRREETFEEWVSNHFGKRLYRAFFKTYTEKVWGIPCHTIHAEWAAQRIRGLSVIAAVKDAIFRNNTIRTLIKEFDYPLFGPGMMWEGFQRAVERGGGSVTLNTEVIRLHHSNGTVRAVTAGANGGKPKEIGASAVLSSMPLPDLIDRLDPPPPADVAKAGRGLRYRAFMLVALIVNRPHVFKDNWIYVHSPDVKVGRIQNYKNWSSAMVPDGKKTSLGMEFFCDEGDRLWTLPDRELILLAARELEILGLGKASDVEGGRVIRQPKAYPVYDPGYRERVETIRQYLGRLGNLQTMGRGGMHRYNNQDHSMTTGIVAARNLTGDTQDLWSVNTESSYYEESVADADSGGML